MNFPLRVDVEAAKRHFLNDGWEMYDAMDATFSFPDNKIIKWDGKSRNGHKTYGSDRGTIIYGSNRTVFVNRDKYILYDRRGKAKLTAPIDDAAISNAMIHYPNIAYRIGKGFDIDDKTGRMFDREAMRLWSRDYEPGWEPKL